MQKHDFRMFHRTMLGDMFTRGMGKMYHYGRRHRYDPPDFALCVAAHVLISLLAYSSMLILVTHGRVKRECPLRARRQTSNHESATRTIDMIRSAFPRYSARYTLTSAGQDLAAWRRIETTSAKGSRCGQHSSSTYHRRRIAHSR